MSWSQIQSVFFNIECRSNTRSFTFQDKHCFHFSVLELVEKNENCRIFIWILKADLYCEILYVECQVTYCFRQLSYAVNSSKIKSTMLCVSHLSRHSPVKIFLSQYILTRPIEEWTPMYCKDCYSDTSWMDTTYDNQIFTNKWSILPTTPGYRSAIS